MSQEIHTNAPEKRKGHFKMPFMLEIEQEVNVICKDWGREIEIIEARDYYTNEIVTVSADDMKRIEEAVYEYEF